MGRYINPGTRDYQIDPDTGDFARMPAVRQRMLILALTVRGSSSVLPNMGVRLPKIMNEAFERRVAAEVRAAARQMTDVEKVARIRDVLVERTGTGRAEITIVYDDLTTGQTGQRVTA